MLVSLGRVNEYLLALKAMRAEGLIPALSGVCWFLLPVGWCSVVSAACEHQQFKQQVILTIRPSNNYTNTLHMGQINRVATAWQR